MRGRVISTSQPGDVRRSSTQSSAVAATARQEAAPQEVPAEDVREPGGRQRHHLVEGDEARCRTRRRGTTIGARRLQLALATPRARPRRRASRRVQLANRPLARVARSAAPPSVGRNEVRRKLSVSSAPTTRIARSVQNTRANESHDFLAGRRRRAASWCGCTRGRTSCRSRTARARSAPRPARPSATWRTGPAQRAPTITSAEASTIAACDDRAEVEEVHVEGAPGGGRIAARARTRTRRRRPRPAIAHSATSAPGSSRGFAMQAVPMRRSLSDSPSGRSGNGCS